MPQRTRIPLGGLELRFPDHLTPDGSLQELENLCYQGPEDAPMYAPVSAPAAITPASAISGNVLAIGRQIRQRRGDLSSQADSGLERWIVMTDRYIYLIDPDNANRTTQVYDFGSAVSTRKAQFAGAGVGTLIAVSVGTGCGAPDALLYLEDDVCVPYEVEIPDDMSETVGITAILNGEGPGLLPGRFAVRYAYKMRDGSIGPASAPKFIDVTGYEGAADDTLAANVSAGDTSFTASGSTSYIIWAGLRSAAETDPTEGWDAKEIVVDGETVRVQSVTYAGSTTTFTLEPGTQFGSAHTSGTNIDWVRPSKLTFAINGALTLPDANYDELTTSVVVLMTPPLDKDEQAFEMPYYQVAEISSLTAGDDAEFYDNNSAIASYPLYEEGQLTTHRIEAASCFSYNSRVLLGDVQYDFRLPEIVPTNTGTTKYIRVGAVIDTANGSFERIGPVTGLAAATGGADGSVVLQDNMIAYPDRRVKEFRFYLLDTTYKLAGIVPAIPAPSGANMAYAFTANPLQLTLTATAMPDADTTNAVLDRDVNRMLYSETFKTFSIPAKNSHYVGLDDDDTIVGFGATGQPVDTGQFGQYPIFVLCKNSIHALQTGSTPFIVGATVLETAVGCLGRYAFVNAGGSVAVATQEGIGFLTARFSDPAISFPLHTQTASGFLDLLDEDTALGYFVQPSRDRRELWVSTASDVYAFSMKHGRWFTMDRARVAFYSGSGGLTGAKSDGTIQDEDGAATTVSCTLKLNPLNMGAAGMMKRFRSFGLRATGTWTNLHLLVEESAAYGILLTAYDDDVDNTDLDERNVFVENGMMIAPVVTITGVGGPDERIESIDTTFTLHTPHRVPVS